MKITKIKLTDSEKKQLVIGRTGEHDVNVIEIDLSHYIDLYGDVTASAIISESVYKNGFPVLSEQDGDVLKIPVTDALTRHSQSYLEIRMITGDGLAKSEIIRLICKTALPDATGDAPTPIADWIERAEKVLKDLQESGVDPEIIEKSLRDYLAENPIEVDTLTEDEVKQIVESYGYITEDHDTIYDDTEIRGLIDEKADLQDIRTELSAVNTGLATLTGRVQTLENNGNGTVVGGGLSDEIKLAWKNALKEIAYIADVHPYTDALITLLDAEDTPPTQVKTLTSITATYSGGNVPVGIAVSNLTGIVVTAHYSDGSAQNVTGYTLSGTISKGTNTVTVSYGGKTTTISVTGAEQTKTLSSISATYGGGSVEEGTAVTSLTGITVTAKYSDDSTQKVTGYSLSGTIAVGSNTITVNYLGKTTTFTVTGTAKPVTRTLQSITATYTGGFVDVGTPAASINGIVVTGHYNIEPLTEVVTGWSISGTVANGKNAFIIMYNGKTTTISIVGFEPVQEYDPESEGYELYDYIGITLSAGNSSPIITNISDKFFQTYDIDIEFGTVNSEKSDARAFIGSRPSAGAQNTWDTNSFAVFYRPDLKRITYWLYGIDSNNHNKYIDLDADGRHLFSYRYDDATITVDDKSLSVDTKPYSSVEQAMNEQLPLALYGYNQPDAETYYASLRFSFNLGEIVIKNPRTGQKVYDLKPCKKISTGTLGFYDTVNGVFSGTTDGRYRGGMWDV